MAFRAMTGPAIDLSSTECSALCKSKFTKKMLQSPGHITELQVFTVAYNPFAGAIRGILKKCAPSSFDGHSPLCGPFMPKWS